MEKRTKEEIVNHFLTQLKEDGYTLAESVNLFEKSVDDKIEIKHEECGTCYKVSMYKFKIGRRCPNKICSNKKHFSSNLVHN